VFGHALYSLHTDNIFTTRHLYHHDQGMYWDEFLSHNSYPLLDLEHEEERGCSGKEEAQDECCSDSGAKRFRFMAFT
jgi:hypothetical protein